MAQLPERRPAKRVSDAQRDECAAILPTHYARGRLSTEELERRLALAQTASTWPELRGLTRDLPRRGRAERAERFHRVVVRAHALGWAATNATTIGAWAAFDSGGFFWPAFVIGPTTALLAAHALAVREWLRRRGR